jgi:hypothetical protein
MEMNQEQLKNSDHMRAWIEECLSLAKQKTSALQQNNLPALENCLEQEALILARRPVFHRNRSTVPASLIAELRTVNRTNHVLASNGLDLCRTLLDTIHPPATYSATASKATTTSVIEPAISVKC